MDNQVTVFGQIDPNEEFPVLKAFQQYITEEQNKARRRMIGLCCFFTVLMVVVIAVFMMMMFQLSSRNQALNDRLVELAMRTNFSQPAQAPVIVQPAAPQAPANNDASMKAITDALAALQKQLADQQRMAEAAMQKAQESSDRPTPEELSLIGQETDKLKKVKERMDKERAKLEAERQRMSEERRKIKEEKERQRQEEVERQRRRLYPEYYAREDAAAQQAAAPAAAVKPPSQSAKTAPVEPPLPKRELSQADIDELLKEVDSILDEGDEVPTADDDDGEMPAVSYFDDDADEDEVPVKINNKATKWRVPKN